MFVPPPHDLSRDLYRGFTYTTHDPDDLIAVMAYFILVCL